jgi:hypothetical protein
MTVRPKELSEKAYRNLTVAGAVFLFGLLLYFSIRLDTKQCPDEAMRVLIPQWIFQHHSLPVGNEPEVVHAIWGTSYGFSPYLPSLFAALNMTVAARFTSSASVLLAASRFQSVVAGVVTWVACCRIGKRLFINRWVSLFFAVSCCYLPQFLFLSSYLNNDGFGVMCTALIVLSWLQGLQDGWTVKNAVFLGVGLGMIAITYYFDYAFILCSIPLFFVSAHRQKLSGRQTAGLALLVFATAFLIGGWFFVRSAVIHDGDFLGMRTSSALAEQLAPEGFKPSDHLTPAKMQLSFKQAFWDTKWFLTSAMSFVACYGLMTFHVPLFAYLAYALGVMVCIAADIRARIQPAAGTQRSGQDLLPAVMLVCGVIPVLLSLYYSYYVDFQPQGRYFISALLPLMYFVSSGMAALARRGKAAAYLPVVGMIVLLTFGLGCAAVLMPQCFA